MQIIYTVQEMLEKTPPELMGDVYSDGIILTGGSSQLFGFDKLISKKTKMPVRIAEEPDMCVARGAGLAIKYIEDIESTAYGAVSYTHLRILLARPKTHFVGIFLILSLDMDTNPCYNTSANRICPYQE